MLCCVAPRVFCMSDPTWGVSNFLNTPRPQAAKFTFKYYEYDPDRLNNSIRLTQVTAYDRCKANRRCNWGIVGTSDDSYHNDTRFFHEADQTLFENFDCYWLIYFID